MTGWLSSSDWEQEKNVDLLTTEIPQLLPGHQYPCVSRTLTDALDYLLERLPRLLSSLVIGNTPPERIFHYFSPHLALHNWDLEFTDGTFCR